MTDWIHPLVVHLSSFLSVEQVMSTPELLEPYSRNCEAVKYAPILVVKIHDTDEIKQILQLANELSSTELHFSVYPISTGKNWGYGSSRAPSSKSVILDLSNLTTVRLIDQTLGLVELEPGVTQLMLSNFLQEHGLDFMVPVTGAGPSCSILGNALERGYGITPYTDHFGAVTSIRGYLADGTRLESAISELDCSKHDFIDHSYKYGVGPYLDGLWTQSNLCVVSSISLRLKARPAKFSAFYLQFKDELDFEHAQRIVFTLLQKLEGTVGSINLMDRRRIAAMMAPNPNGPEKHQVMSPQQVNAISNSFQIPAWTVVGSLYGEAGMVKAAKKIVKHQCRGVRCKIILSDSPLIQAANWLLPHLPDRWIHQYKGMLASMQFGIDIMLGKPNQVALPLAYWRNPSVQANRVDLNLNPAKDGCGLLWYAPLVPMHLTAMTQFIDAIRCICPKHGIEPMITFTSLRHDCVDSTIPILFDASNKEASLQAKACLDELVQFGLKKGWVPYRLNLEQQQTLLNPNSPHWQTVQRIKKALDPNNVISPGRYNP